MRLPENDLLQELDKPEWRALRHRLTTRTYPKGCLVFSPGEPENLLFIVARGRARIYLAYREKEFTMALLGAGDVYTTHTRAHVEALEDLELLVADIAVVRRFLTTMPTLATAMVTVLGDLLGHAFSVIDGLVFHDVRRRLIHLLLREAEHACPDSTTPCLTHGLSTEQLATIVGSSRQTVSSLLNALEREGLIELRGRGRIGIPNLDALQRLADT